MRRLALLALVACAPVAPTPTPSIATADLCTLGPAGVAQRGLADLKAATKARERETSFTIPLAAPPERVTPIVVAHFARCGLPPTGTTGGTIESALGAQTGALGSYEITARAVVAPNPTGGSLVILSADETARYSTGDPRPTTARIGGWFNGRSGATWQILRVIADTLAADATLAPAGSP